MLLVLSLSVTSQNLDDIQNILLLCFEHADMPTEAHLNDEGIPVLVITGDGVLPEDLTLSWFGEPVLQLGLEEITAQNIEAFLQFESINIYELEANVTFLYHSLHPIQDLSFRFQKANGNWSKIE